MNLNLIHSLQRHVPKAHLTKLGTMGEYVYDPGLEIPEGFYEIKFRGKKQKFYIQDLPRVGTIGWKCMTAIT